MSEDTDWGTYVHSTHNRYVMHYLVYAEDHNQPTAADYNALEAEHSTILSAMITPTRVSAGNKCVNLPGHCANPTMAT
jgi:hypothetical protein